MWVVSEKETSKTLRQSKMLDIVDGYFEIRSYDQVQISINLISLRVLLSSNMLANTVAIFSMSTSSFVSQQQYQQAVKDVNKSNFEEKNETVLHGLYFRLSLV